MPKPEVIIIGSDHAGYALKERIKTLLSDRAIQFKDVGVASADQPSDFPVQISEVATAVSAGEYSQGIAIDGMGIGASMVANRFPRVRAALCANSEMARIARGHNDANVLVLGGWLVSDWTAEQILDTWMKTRFEGGRHQRRVSLIDDNTAVKIAIRHLEGIQPETFAATSIDEQLRAMVGKGVERLRSLFVSEERRTQPETRLTESCPAVVTYEGQKSSAIMTDLSDSGAQFRPTATNKKCLFKVGDAMELEIKTPYGKSYVTGTVMWIDTSFYCTWGVKFTKLSPDKKDPLRSLMDSSM